jgi:hypothetical protein
MKTSILFRSAPLALAALAFLPLSSCIVLVGAGAGYVISQEVLPGSVHQAQVNENVDKVWAQAQETLHDMKVGDFETTNYPRRIETTVDGADIEVVVEAYDLNRTIIKVTAKRYLTFDNDLAGLILNQILDDLGTE